MKQLLRPLLLLLLWRAVSKIVRAENPRVIVVTGSIGKTSTKEAIAAVLDSSEYPVIKTEGNLGTDTGVPLSLLGFSELPARLGWISVLFRALRPPFQQFAKRPYYVLEYSSDKPGDLQFLTKQLPADVGVISQVAPVHLQAFPNFDALIKEELAVIDGLTASGVLVLNAADPIQTNSNLRGKEAVWYGKDYTASLKSEGLELRLATGEIYQTAVFGRHQLLPILAAVAVGKLEGLPYQHIAVGVAKYQVPPGRGRILKGKQGISIIDDTYNASPEAVKAALQMLVELASSRRTVAILGRMNELGERAEELHRQVAANAKVDLLVLVGEFAGIMQEAAEAAGTKKTAIVTFQTPELCLAGIEGLLKPKDLVLIKASQNGMRLERVVKLLLENPAEASNLVRQSVSFGHA